MSITHSKVSAISDGGDASLVLPSDWNAAHVVPSRELDYVQFTSPVSITATTGATANTVVTGSSVAYDGSTIVIIEFFDPQVSIVADDRFVSFVLYDGSTELGILSTTKLNAETATDNRWSVFASRRLTPSNASHTYSIRGYITPSGTASADAGAGTAGNLMPGFIRITRAQ